MNQKEKTFKNKPVDLVKDFYDQDIDHKALEKALTQRKNTAKGFTNFSLDPFTGEFGDAQKKHLLNRTMVGYCNRHHRDLEGLDLDEAVDLIFSEDIFNEPTNIYYWEKNADQYKNRYQSDDVGPNQPFINRPYLRSRPTFEEQFGEERQRAIYWSLYGGMYNQNTSIHYRLFLFLHNLVPTDSFTQLGHKGGYNYVKTLFDSCFGSYKDFIYDITLDGSMLVYLNLYLSTKETPDENYAREVQELFTVGKRPFAKFTEGDVREAARVLVGWRHDYDRIVYDEGHQNLSLFQDYNHDDGDKFFSSFYGNKIIRGRKGEDGANELQEFVDMLCEVDEHPIYIVRRLYQFFVYPALTDEIEENIIKPLSKIYKDNNYSLVEPLKVLLKSRHFFENQIENSLIKSPIEYSMGLLKEVDLINNGVLHHWDGSEQHYSIFEPDYFGEKEKDPNYLKYKISGDLTWYFGKELGMGLLQPPSVSGWPALYQEPVYDLFWINSSTLTRRINCANDFLRWGYWMDIFIGEEGGVQKRFNLINYLKTFDDPGSINSFINELIFRFLGGETSTNTTNKINQALLGDIDESHWTEEINNLINNSTSDNKNSYRNIEWRISNVFDIIGQIGEFHLF
jgi:uncharacterized protein (DUF1800 family)